MLFWWSSKPASRENTALNICAPSMYMHAHGASVGLTHCAVNSALDQHI